MHTTHLYSYARFMCIHVNAILHLYLFTPTREQMQDDVTKITDCEYDSALTRQGVVNVHY